MERTPAEIAAKQIRNTSAAVPDVIAGVNAVTESPMEKAAAALPKAQARYIEAITSGKTARHLLGVSLPSWKKSTTDKAPRIAEGIAAAESKLVRFHTARQPIQAAISGEIAAMPSLTLEDNIARSAKQQRAMAGWTWDKSAP